jgi:hypothetical protein
VSSDEEIAPVKDLEEDEQAKKKTSPVADKIFREES